MTEDVQMVLGAIEKLNSKLDDVKDTVSEIVADTAARLAVLEEWKRSAQELNLDNRVRALETDRVTLSRIDSLQAELCSIKEAQASSKLKERAILALASILLSGLGNLLVHFWTTK